MINGFCRFNVAVSVGGCGYLFVFGCGLFVMVALVLFLPHFV